jgi:hypothetical protein
MVSDGNVELLSPLAALIPTTSRDKQRGIILSIHHWSLVPNRFKLMPDLREEDASFSATGDNLAGSCNHQS